MSKTGDAWTHGLHQTKDKKFLVELQWPVLADFADHRTRQLCYFFSQSKTVVLSLHMCGLQDNVGHRNAQSRRHAGLNEQCMGAPSGRLAERSGQCVSRLRRVIRHVPLECQSDAGGGQPPSFCGQATPMSKQHLDTVWTEKWKRHGWRTSSGEVGHRDLWEHIDWQRGEAGDMLQARWVPSHLGVARNEAADELAGQGRELHPYNLLPLSKRRRVTEWDALGWSPWRKRRTGTLGQRWTRGGRRAVARPRHRRQGTRTSCPVQTTSCTARILVTRGCGGYRAVTVTNLARMSVRAGRGGGGGSSFEAGL